MVDISKYEKYDAALLGILQHEGRISNFLEAIFGFLYRRTDFYVMMKSKNDKMGFPPGIAFKQVAEAYKIYQDLTEQNTKRNEKTVTKKSQSIKDNNQTSQTQVDSGHTGVSKKVTVPNEQNSKLPQSDQCQSPHPAENPATTSQSSITEKTPSSSQSEHTQKTASKCADSSVTNTTPPGDGDNGDDDPEQTRLQRIFQANPESHNGAIREKYTWSQSITDVDVHIVIPKSVTKGKEVKVRIDKKHLKAEYRDSSGEWLTVVDGTLSWNVNKEESMWSLVPGEHIHVNLEKVQERWWDAVLDGEPKISVRKIDPSRPMSDLDDEAQIKIEEMMYNQRQKQLGLPQSHELKVHSMLKKAWDVDGSPFKGQEFDPSKFNISPNNVMDTL